MIRTGDQVWLPHLVGMRSLSEPGYYAATGQDLCAMEQILPLLLRYQKYLLYTGIVTQVVNSSPTQITSESTTYYTFDGLIRLRSCYNLHAWFENVRLSLLTSLVMAILDSYLKAFVEPNKHSQDELAALLVLCTNMCHDRDILVEPAPVARRISTECVTRICGWLIINGLPLLQSEPYKYITRLIDEITEIFTYTAGLSSIARYTDKKLAIARLYGILTNNLKEAIHEGEIPEFCIARDT